MQITVKASDTKNSDAKPVTVKTAKMISRSDALNDGGKDVARKGYVN